MSVSATYGSGTQLLHQCRDQLILNFIGMVSAKYDFAISNGTRYQT